LTTIFITMDKKKVFVYDSAKGFSRFIKMNFNKEFEIISCTNKKRLIEYDLNKIDFAFFIINDFDDIINFIWTFSKVKRIYLGTHNEEINKKLKDNEAIVLLNLSQKKTELIEEIKQNIKIYNLVEF
jgi:hypothetical protein